MKPIELIQIKSTIKDWGYIFFPAKAEDRPIFYHCTGVGMEYMFRGGIVNIKLVEMALPIFRMHGRDPVIVAYDQADWAIPLMEGEKGHLNKED